MSIENKAAALIEKMNTEQENYRNWLLSLSPEEMLDHAYEFAIRREMMAVIENIEVIGLSEKQADALLKSENPLADIYKGFTYVDTQFPDIVRGCVEEHAKMLVQQAKEPRQASKPSRKARPSVLERLGAPTLRQTLPKNSAKSREQER